MKIITDNAKMWVAGATAWLGGYVIDFVESFITEIPSDFEMLFIGIFAAALTWIVPNKVSVGT
jgi:hypothetical protein